MTCPQPDTDACTDATPCAGCPAVCPHCGETWQAHVDGNPCSAPGAVTQTWPVRGQEGTSDGLMARTGPRVGVAEDRASYGHCAHCRLTERYGCPEERQGHPHSVPCRPIDGTTCPGSTPIEKHL